MKRRYRVAAFAVVLVLCMSLLAACGPSSNNQPGTETQPPETQLPETQTPDQTPTEIPQESEKPEDTRVVKEDYVFEGLGIFQTVANHPDTYTEEATQQGTVKRVTYNNGTEEKYFNIYLPYRYDSNDDNYNVLYLMHGGGAGSPENFIREDRLTALQKVIDNMIQNGDVEPFILVAPSWKTSSVDPSADDYHDNSMELSKLFAETEFAEYVIPLVDGNYRTNATREGRAFAGFSMGGVTTWNIFLYDLAYIKYFIPMSGDCWVIEQTGGATKPEETVAALEKAVADQGYTGSDFVMYIFTGTQDYALPNMAPQIYAMQDSELFVFGENTFFGAYVDGVHGDPWSKTYLYNALPLLWQND